MHNEYVRIRNVVRRRLHEDLNDNDIRLKDFSISRNMAISSMRFPHKDIHKEQRHMDMISLVLDLAELLTAIWIIICSKWE
jgi:hypothetical protein